MDVDVEPHMAQVRAMLKNGGDGDQIDYQLESQNQLRIQLRFESQGGGTQNTIQMEVTFHSIVEYEDTDGDGELSPGDEVVSTYDLETAGFGEFQHQTRKTMDGKDEDVVTGKTSDGVFGVVAHFSGEDARLASGDISPNWMKMDFIIEDYPYVRTTTQLALRTRLDVEGPVSVITDPTTREYLGDDEGAVEGLKDGLSAYYSWRGQAEVDGVTSTVRTRVSVEQDGTYISYSYQRGDSINHDPKLGLPLGEALVPGEAFDLLGHLLPFVGALVIGAVVIGAAVGARRRRNGRH